MAASTSVDRYRIRLPIRFDLRMPVRVQSASVGKEIRSLVAVSLRVRYFTGSWLLAGCILLNFSSNSLDKVASMSDIETFCTNTADCIIIRSF